MSKQVIPNTNPLHTHITTPHNWAWYRITGHLVEDPLHLAIAFSFFPTVGLLPELKKFMQRCIPSLAAPSYSPSSPRPPSSKPLGSMSVGTQSNCIYGDGIPKLMLERLCISLHLLTHISQWWYILQDVSHLCRLVTLPPMQRAKGLLKHVKSIVLESPPWHLLEDNLDMAILQPLSWHVQGVGDHSPQ